jgi:Tn3 transposase DDE domain
VRASDGLCHEHGPVNQQTPLHPREILTDTGAYADVIFGLLWLLGYQLSPRISDIGGTRFWRIDREADYGGLNDLAAHRIRPQLIVEHWDDLLRIAGSLTLGSCHIESLMRTLQCGTQQTKLARALQELGRVIKTLFLLNYLNDEAYRRRILTQLNRGEGRHRLARSPTPTSPSSRRSATPTLTCWAATPSRSKSRSPRASGTCSAQVVSARQRLHVLAYWYFLFHFYRRPYHSERRSDQA